ncbi:unnamed protein product [Heligmosomoides polygyrus]|uniref:Intracellular growth attenuator protein igaA n=1 Tax=Heligmosomoides polygyrus TaxID=6339 RepID=A0A183FY05_HELPZ|nr:unnamed protein product [Heligmosomoides polygyrus]
MSLRNILFSKQTVQASFFLFHLSLWQLLIVVIPSVTFLVLIALTLVAWFRVRRRKTAFLKRMPDPFMISGMHTLPDTSNTPQSFLDRLNQLQQAGTVVRERDHCEVWTNPQRAPSFSGSVVRA